LRGDDVLERLRGEDRLYDGRGPDRVVAHSFDNVFAGRGNDTVREGSAFVRFFDCEHKVG
jgi:hypothetical protein